VRHRRELLGRLAQLGEQPGEGAAGEETDVLGEHREQAAHEELRRRLGVVAGGFERAGERGEMRGHLASDAGGTPRRVERGGVGPHRAHSLADLLALEIGEGESVRAGVGEREVRLAGAREVGVQLDRVADVDDDHERRIALARRQRAHVLLGLAAGAEHRIIPACGAAARGALLDAAR
jgi:hypothetical protein